MATWEEMISNGYDPYNSGSIAESKLKLKNIRAANQAQMEQAIFARAGLRPASQVMETNPDRSNWMQTQNDLYKSTNTPSPIESNAETLNAVTDQLGGDGDSYDPFSEDNNISGQPTSQLENQFNNNGWDNISSSTAGTLGGLFAGGLGALVGNKFGMSDSEINANENAYMDSIDPFAVDGNIDFSKMSDIEIEDAINWYDANTLNNNNFYDGVSIADWDNAEPADTTEEDGFGQMYDSNSDGVKDSFENDSSWENDFDFDTNDGWDSNGDSDSDGDSDSGDPSGDPDGDSVGDS